MPSVSIERVCPAAAFSIARSAASSSAASASRCVSSASTSAPRSLPTSTTKLWRPSSSTSVSARSKPAVAFGPVSIETQKQVAAAWPQLTATMNAPSRRAR